MNSFGRIFRITLFGESHGQGIGVTIDGVKPGVSLDVSDFDQDLERRRGGRQGTTPRIEADVPEIFSGVYQGKATGAPLTILFRNENIRTEDYEKYKDIPRPGHADFSAQVKYHGFNDPGGGGHFSGRLTLGLVAAGVIAKKMIDPVHCKAEILEIGGNPNLKAAVETLAGTADSLGGLVQCTATNLPAGLGEPFFDSVESMVSHLVFSIPAIKGIEFGSGFRAANMKGSEFNDPIIDRQGTTQSNHAGGINGGITNGNNLVFRVAVKPASGISLPQTTLNMASGNMEEIIIGGRHDQCIALRMPVILEAATAIVLADLLAIR
jgi:chorismate synthase